MTTLVRRFLPDLLFIVLAALAALYASGMPGGETGAGAAPLARAAEATVEAAPPGDSPRAERPDGAGRIIAGRDIFAAADGPAESAPASDRAYRLLGIVREGGAMKALFRDNAGEVFKTAAGERLPGGFMVALVRHPQVVLARGSERRVFNVFDSAPSPSAQHGEKANQTAGKPALIAILEGRDRRALLKDPAGQLIIAGPGQSLADGAVVGRIDSRTVTLRKGTTETELVLYAEASSRIPELSAPEPPRGKTQPPVRQRPAAPRIPPTASGGRDGA